MASPASFLSCDCSESFLGVRLVDISFPIGIGCCCVRCADFSGGGGGSDFSSFSSSRGVRDDDVTGFEMAEENGGVDGTFAVEPLLVDSFKDGGFESREMLL